MTRWWRQVGGGVLTALAWLFLALLVVGALAFVAAQCAVLVALS